MSSEKKNVTEVREEKVERLDNKVFDISHIKIVPEVKQTTTA
jgi:hypothetical protein